MKIPQYKTDKNAWKERRKNSPNLSFFVFSSWTLPKVHPLDSRQFNCAPGRSIANFVWRRATSIKYQCQLNFFSLDIFCGFSSTIYLCVCVCIDAISKSVFATVPWDDVYLFIYFLSRHFYSYTNESFHLFFSVLFSVLFFASQVLRSFFLWKKCLFDRINGEKKSAIRKKSIFYLCYLSICVEQLLYIPLSFYSLVTRL